MVNDDAQLYTIEAFAAALVMILTAVIVFGTTSVYTPGDEHIADMQLQQLGNDALAIMDTLDGYNDPDGITDLQYYIEKNKYDEFEDAFQDYLEMNTGSTLQIHDIRYIATVYYRNDKFVVNSYEFTHSGDHIAREPSVRASRWLQLDSWPDGHPSDMRQKPQMVLLEVQLWRGGDLLDG